MPEYLKYQDKEILKRIYEDILYRDIVSRYDVKEVKSLRELSLYYFSNFSNLVSFNKLKSILNLGSVNTVKSYTNYLENSYLFFAINIFSFKVSQQFIAPKKIFCIDNGLAESVSFAFSQNIGRFLENLVFTELKRRGREIYYYKTKNGQEIDFVLRQGRDIAEILQVSDNILDSEVRKREINSTLTALLELNIKKGVILTSDQKETIKEKNKIIEIIPIYEWLLNY